MAKAWIVGLLCWLAGGTQAWAISSSIQISNFTLNPSLMLQMYNAAQQNQGTVTSYPAGMDPGVLTMDITNSGNTPCQPSIGILITDPTDPGVQVVTASPIVTKNPIPAGARVHLTAADFQTGINFNGKVDTSWSDANLKDVQNNPSNLQSLMTRKFNVCVTPTDCTPVTPIQGVPDCTQFSIVLGSPNGDCSVAELLSPHNQGVQGLPFFVWVPCRSTKFTVGQVTHRLQILPSFDSQTPLFQLDLPAGTSTYQFKASDYALVPGTKYYWRVICIGPDGNPFCGPNGSGTNIVKWFIFGNSASSAASVSCVLRQVQARVLAAVGADLGQKVLQANPAQVQWSGPVTLDELCAKLTGGSWVLDSAEPIKQ